MFFIIGIGNGSSELGARRCRTFACCRICGAAAMVTCVYQQFTLFFLPLFRFGKRYFVTCPGCGAVFELSKAEGKRIERDPNAEIDPEQMYRTGSPAGRICPSCRRPVASDAHFCPNCGTKLN